MVIWVLIDNKIGSNMQSLALAKGLSNGYIVKNIKYNRFIRLPNFLRGSGLLGIDKGNSDNIFDNLPNLVISAGRRLASVALNIKKRSKGKTKVVAILNPNFCYSKFDAVILPQHDHKNGKNVINFIGSITGLSQDRMIRDANEWRTIFDKYKKPLVAVLIGGDSKDRKFDPQSLCKIFALKESLLVNTTRRTSPACMEEIKKHQYCYLYDWSREQGQNTPYFACLSLADYIIITGDSINMVAEACSTGKPVYIYMPKESLSKKHYNFCNQMISGGFAREFTGTLEKYEYEPLNELERVVKELKSII